MSEVGILWYVQENEQCLSIHPSNFISRPTIGIKIVTSSEERLANKASGNSFIHGCDILSVIGSASIFLA